MESETTTGQCYARWTGWIPLVVVAEWFEEGGPEGKGGLENKLFRRDVVFGYARESG